MPDLPSLRTSRHVHSNRSRPASLPSGRPRRHSRCIPSVRNAQRQRPCVPWTIVPKSVIGSKGWNRSKPFEGSGCAAHPFSFQQARRGPTSEYLEYDQLRTAAAIPHVLYNKKALHAPLIGTCVSSGLSIFVRGEGPYNTPTDRPPDHSQPMESPISQESSIPDYNGNTPNARQSP